MGSQGASLLAPSSADLASDSAPSFHAQWESAELVAQFLAGRDAATDPRWSRSGAASAAEYALWADHLCGMACLKMALGGRHSIHTLRRAVQAHGAYVETPAGIKGLIYAGAVAWLQAQGIAAHIALDVEAEDVPGDGMFIASVHPGIRRPDTPPPRRGGHLVLVFGRDAEGRLRFHNPSGDSPATQRDVRLHPEAFGAFFAGRGIALPR